MFESPQIFIASAVRTPIGRFGGALSTLTAPQMGAIAARAAIERAGISASDVEETLMGHARPAGAGPNPARQIAHRAGIPESSPAYTINMACGSSLRAILTACESIAAGSRDIVLAGGTESMSRVPYLLDGARWGYRMGNQRIVDAMYRDGFLCPLCDQIMGETAENLVDRYDISRSEQDAYAAESQNRCERALREGSFRDEIIPVAIEGKRGSSMVEEDECPRAGVTAESLARLPPVFRKEGIVHAGASSALSDAAAATVVVSGEAVRRLGLKPLVRVVAATTSGVDPSIMGIAPVPAVRKLVEKTGVPLGEIDVIELNEAFAAQVLACHRDLQFDMARVNVNGGAIALGHPIGATGARITTTLIHEMRRRGARLGLSTLCISGGLGIALLLESTRA